MNPLVSCEQFLSRVPANAIIPLDADNAPDTARINIALRDATGIIVANLPWLLDKATGQIAQPVNAQFADALFSICVDIALFRLTDSVSGSEDARARYNDNMKLLEKINKEFQGGLEGPGLQASEVVVPEAGEDKRFWKKGRLF